MGKATLGNQPNLEWRMRLTILRSRASGERNASPTLRTSPLGMPAASGLLFAFVLTHVSVITMANVTSNRLIVRNL
jgi:hypothetical protein